MSIEDERIIISEDDIDDFENISFDQSSHKTSSEGSFELMEPGNYDKSKYSEPSKEPQQCFGSELGLFSKFTNMRTITDGQSHNSPGKPRSRPEKEIESLSLLKKAKESSGKAASRGTQKKPTTGFAISVLAVFFSIQFANSLEMIYITPYFLELEINDWLDATFWMFPVALATLLTPCISIVTRHAKHQRMVQIVLMMLSSLGCFFFGYIDRLVEAFEVAHENRTVFFTWMGLVAFCFIDVSNEMAQLIQNKILEESVEPDSPLLSQVNVVSFMGKIFGFFCGSLQALQFNFYKVLGRNMDFCFFLGGAFIALSLILTWYFHPTIGSSPEKSSISSLRELQITSFLPITSKFKTASAHMKIIMAAHFFGASNILMLSVYATSWIGQDILRGNPDGPSHSMESNLFEFGISWGSVALLLTSIITMFTGFGVDRMIERPNKFLLKSFFILSQLLAAIGLLSCAFVNDFNDVFVILPLTGFAFQTFQVLPEVLADLLEKQEKRANNIGEYKQLLSFNLFYAQMLTFLIIPLVFLLFPNRNDNLWGVLIAGASGLISTGFALFM